MEMNPLPKRKNNRLSFYDYDSAGAYFITICTQNRTCILSRIVGDDALGVPKLQLTQLGKIVEARILSGNQMDRISVKKYVIMPNHVHILLCVDMDTSGTPGASSPTMAVVPRFVAAFKRLVHQEFGEKIFQRSYHDHVIRDQRDYMKIWEYIENNPRQWERDRFYLEEK